MLGSQRFPVRVRLLAVCRCELSAVIAWLISKCLWSGLEVVVRSLWNALPLPLQSCDSWMFVKENPDRKKKQCRATNFLPFAKVSSCKHIECLWTSHLDFAEHIFMDLSYRFTNNLEAIKGKERCSWNLDKIFTNYLQWTHFQAKLKSGAVRLSDCFPEQAVYSFYSCIKNSCFIFSLFSN